MILMFELQLFMKWLYNQESINSHKKPQVFRKFHSLKEEFRLNIDIFTLT